MLALDLFSIFVSSGLDKHTKDRSCFFYKGYCLKAALQIAILIQVNQQSQNSCNAHTMQQLKHEFRQARHYFFPG